MLPSQADARCPACRHPVLARQKTCGVCGAVPWVHAGYEAARDCPAPRCAGGHVREAAAA